MQVRHPHAYVLPNRPSLDEVEPQVLAATVEQCRPQDVDYGGRILHGGGPHGVGAGCEVAVQVVFCEKLQSKIKYLTEKEEKSRRAAEEEKSKSELEISFLMLLRKR